MARGQFSSARRMVRIDTTTRTATGTIAIGAGATAKRG
jgi:hypothetical protein